jgi:dienelactone hydrolase
MPMRSQRNELAITITAEGISLSGFLGIPPQGKGVVLFAHGSGSGRFSPRNRLVAHHLQKGGIATVLVDLLMTDEEDDRRKVFDIDLLADRLLMASAWLRQNTATKHLPLGYFGASTGAGAALQAAARARFPVAAIVSRGGRPDRDESRGVPPSPLSQAAHDHPWRHTFVRRTWHTRASGRARAEMVCTAFRWCCLSVSQPCSNHVTDLLRGLLG